MGDGFGWLIALLGIISFFKGMENISPRVARNLLKKRMEQPDYFFRAAGVMFVCAGIAIIYIGLR